MPGAQFDEQAIFESARQIESASARLAFVEQSCHGDAELQRRLIALLDAWARESAFLEPPTVGLLANAFYFDVNLADDGQITKLIGSTIGPYRLLEQIGEGGFGVVYLAEQLRPVKRRVALKLIKPGMDTREVVARFEAERQALALMDHPNIAKVYDAGSTDKGRPYFVMELVQGVPITEYGDQCNLNTRDRLELFITVCHAVQHAHQNGVIHRDIKPTNVLVTIQDRKPAAKIIDFGVAKALSQRLTEHTLATGYAQMVGTPLYMSPEQAELSPLGVDTRSDIYSLGVLLYELLIGTTPFDQNRLREAGYDEMRRIIREEDPLRPSIRISTLDAKFATTVAEHRRTDVRRLSQAVCGELDWIVMKCLEKDRARRYESVSAFVDDIQNYIHDLPVAACPPSPWYRFRKFSQRNKAILSAMAALIAALLLGIAGTSWQAIKATAERDRAVLAETTAAAEAQKATRATEKESRLRRETRRLLYVSDMGQANHALEQNSLGRAVELLTRYLPQKGEEDLRGFDWYYLWRRCHRHEFEIEDAGWQLAISPDATTIAAGRRDGTIKLIDVSSRSTRAILAEHTMQVESVAFSPNGQSLASASADHSVKLWNVASGKLIATFDGHTAAVHAVSFSPDGEELASASSDRTIKTWDLTTLQPKHTLRGQERALRGLAYSPDGQWLVAGGGDYARAGELFMWDVRTGEQKATFSDQFLNAPPYFVLAVAYSPDGAILATVGRDRLIRLWDPKLQEVKRVLGRRNRNWKYSHIYPGHTDWIVAIAFSPDGDKVVSLCVDGSLKLWDVVSGNLITTLPAFDARAWSVVFSPNGKSFLSADEKGNIKSWDCASLALEESLPHRLKDAHSLAISPNGDIAAINGPLCGLQLIDLQTGQTQRQLRDTSPEFTSARMSPDGTLLICGTSETSIEVWTLPQGRLKSLRSAHQKRSIEFAFSPDGRTFASASSDGNVVLWSAAKLEAIKTLRAHTGPVCSLAFAHDGNSLATGSVDQTVNIWDLKTGKVRQRLEGHQATVRSIAYSLDGTLIATGTQYPDCLIRLWDAKTGRLEATLKGHANAIWGVVFLDDSTLASVAADKTVRMWNLPTRKETLALSGHGHYIRGVALSRDRSALYTTGVGGEVRVWRAATSGDVQAWQPKEATATDRNQRSN